MKGKSVIITVTAGDFEYIDEWIDYHHNLGVELFLIGYNGPSSKFRNYKERDYVRFIDFSYNNTNIKKFYGSNFSSYGENRYTQGRQEKILNILFEYARFIYTDYAYTIVIDTDEFIKIKTTKYKDIGEYLFYNFKKNDLAKSLIMNFASDNNIIFKDDRSQDKFYNPDLNVGRIDGKIENHQHGKKIVIRMKHPNVILGKVFMYDAHRCAGYTDGYDFDFNDIELVHYWTKSLEEWIEKMNPDVDPSYYNRWKGQIFSNYFGHNKLTKEKALAIPDLLRKYNIDYDFLSEEPIEFVEAYKKIIE